MEDWIETYFMVAQYMTLFEDTSELVQETRKNFGRAALPYLAQVITEEFEFIHKDTNWGVDLDWEDTLYEFITNKLGVELKDI